MGDALTNLIAKLNEKLDNFDKRLETVTQAVSSLQATVDVLSSDVKKIDLLRSDIKKLREDENAHHGRTQSQLGHVFEIAVRNRLEQIYGRDYARPFVIGDLFGLARLGF